MLNPMFVLLFFLVGIIFTLMSLENNYVFTPKHLIYKDKKPSFFKIIFDIIIVWYFVANTVVFFYISYDVLYPYVYQGPKFIKIVFTLFVLTNAFITPFLLYKRLIFKNKNKG